MQTVQLPPDLFDDLTSEMHIIPRRERMPTGVNNWSLSIKRISCQQILVHSQYEHSKIIDVGLISPH